MQSLIAGGILAAAVIYMIYRFVNARKGGCGCGHDCCEADKKSCPAGRDKQQ